jgi:hypothetical protein
LGVLQGAMTAPASSRNQIVPLPARPSITVEASDFGSWIGKIPWQDIHPLDGAFEDALQRNGNMGRITRSNLIRIVFASGEYVGGLVFNVTALETYKKAIVISRP